ncbi:DUF2703 domain-containing protein [Sphingobacteriales bacterium CHB3]|nr:DUF2703 domain-containing protein [Sphingobacteriales bacterium CHB3]
MNKLRIEFQYFEDCPNHKRMKDNLLKAMEGIEDSIELINVLVEDEQTASRVNFRGSPTLLINGEDVENMPAPERPSVACRLPAPERPSVACRFYPNGIPSAEAIRSRIEQHL